MTLVAQQDRRIRTISKSVQETTSQTPSKTPQGKALLDVVVKSLDDNKAQELVVVELSGKSDIADYLVVASGTSGRQVGAMAEHLRTCLKATGYDQVPVEGMPQCDWVLVDAGDVIIHLFRPEVRAFYNIEKMWDTPVSEAEA